MIYAIPSYRRHGLIETHTLQVLKDNGVNDYDIAIFVSNEDEEALYTAALRHRPGIMIVLAPSNSIVQKFNFIHNWFAPGAEVVFVEDDLTALKGYVNEKTLATFTALPELARSAFETCRNAGTKLWGISSNANPFYMKPGVSVGFKFIVANLFGFIATRDPFLAVSQVCKSDYERTLLYYIKYGSVVRCDGVCAITKNYKTPGGLQTLIDRATKEEQSCRQLVARFPHLIEINEKKSKTSMFMELKIKHRPKKDCTDLMALQKLMDAK